MSGEIPSDIPKSRETILKVATKFNIYFLLVITLLAGAMAIVGIIQMNNAGKETLKGVPEYALLLVVGMIGFSLFFPWFTALFFARHCIVAAEQLEAENRDLRVRLEAVEYLLRGVKR